jgi:hypothetical protein
MANELAGITVTADGPYPFLCACPAHRHSANPEVETTGSSLP